MKTLLRLLEKQAAKSNALFVIVYVLPVVVNVLFVELTKSDLTFARIRLPAHFTVTVVTSLIDAIAGSAVRISSGYSVSVAASPSSRDVAEKRCVPSGSETYDGAVMEDW